MYAYSGNECAYPGCGRLLFVDEFKSGAGEICHIEALRPGGARYNLSMTTEERNYHDNLIILCREHHNIIDSDEKVYTVEKLKQWKNDREYEQKARSTNLLRLAIDAISEANLGDISTIPEGEAIRFEIDDKINHNAIKRKRDIIQKHSAYYVTIRGIYNELEGQGAAFKTEQLLGRISYIYLREKEALVRDSDNEMDIVRKHADDIFDRVEDRLFEVIGVRDLFKFGFALSIIMVDAFMRCGILENPNVEKSGL